MEAEPNSSRAPSFEDIDVTFGTSRFGYPTSEFRIALQEASLAELAAPAGSVDVARSAPTTPPVALPLRTSATPASSNLTFLVAIGLMVAAAALLTMRFAGVEQPKAVAASAPVSADAPMTTSGGPATASSSAGPLAEAPPQQPAGAPSSHLKAKHRTKAKTGAALHTAVPSNPYPTSKAPLPLETR